MTTVPTAEMPLPVSPSMTVTADAVSTHASPTQPAPTHAQLRLEQALGGRYVVERELGRGGMATVYLAKDVKHERQVAIKVMLPELAASIGAERFEREIRLAAKLQHPHILGLYDSGVADGQVYYVMPFVQGESLRDRLEREGQLSVDDAVRITVEVASALGHAHEHGIVHRDIKPENIMLSGDHALVADFGIARAVSDAGGAKLTQTGMAVGTPVYMAPEQSAGEGVGPTADLYSLGCMLYEMLAGEPPFTGKSAMAIMARHIMEQVPSVRIVRTIVPEEVEEAIFAAMAKAPVDRPQSAAAFVEMLGASMGTSTSTRMRTTMRGRPTPFRVPEVATPFWRKPAAVAAAVMVLAAGALGAWKMTAAPKATQGVDAKRLAVLYFADLSPDSSLGPLADGLTEELIRSLSTASSITTISRSGVEKFRGSAVTPDSIARALRVGFLVRGSVQRAGNTITVNVSLDDAQSGEPLKTEKFSGAAGNQLALRDTIAVVASDLIRQQLGQKLQLSDRRFRTSSTDAWLFSQRAEQAWKGADAALLTGDAPAGAQRFTSADSLFILAGQADTKWPEPYTRRAVLTFRRARLAGRDVKAVEQWVNQGIALADTALTLDRDNADALEARGNVRYFGWLTGIEADAATKDAAIAQARADLERATMLNGRQAGAWATLSHMYYQLPDQTPTDVLIAAQRAFEADEFLSNANVILARMFNANYDLGAFPKAAHWCMEVRRRFPKDVRAMRCRLYMLTARTETPDIPAAWAIADSAVQLVAPAAQPFEKLTEHMLVAAVIARAATAQGNPVPALIDSARNVAKRSIGDPEIDQLRELALYGAFVSTQLGDTTDAIRRLKEFLAANPQRVASLRADPGWWFRPLANNAQFRQALGSQ